jgi:mercuric ion binding protein
MKSIKILVLMLALLTSSIASAKTVEMKVNGLVCAFCAQGIEKTLKGFPATAAVFVSLEHRLVAVQLKEGEDIPDAALKKAITNAGYALVSVSRTENSLASLRAKVGKEKALPTVNHKHEKGESMEGMDMGEHHD